jgi:competence protein ComEC
LYALVTDAQPPVVRATVLVLGGAAAWLLYRPAGGFNLLAAAAIVVLALNPTSLLHVGAQLSFLAVGTLVACQRLLLPQPIADPLDRLIAASRPWHVRGLRGAAALLGRAWLGGALVWLVSMPLVWEHFCLVSLAALVLNVLLWVPVSVAMYGGMASLLVGGLWPAAGRWCAAVCNQCLALLEWGVAAGSGWPGGHFWLPPPPAWWVAVYYGVALAALALPRWRPPVRWLIGLALAWLAIALPLSSCPEGVFPSRQKSALVGHVIAVGHGASVLLELPDGHTLLYDAGRLGMPEAAVRSISSVLWSRGVRHLDAVILSHADADHFNALPGLLQRFSVGVVYVGPAMFDDRPPAVAALYEAITSRGVPLREVWSGHQALCGDALLAILHPPREGIDGSDNARSVVLLVAYAGRRLLLTGDLEPPGLDALLAQPPLDCDVVLAPHHGSPRSRPLPFTQWCRPELLIISGSHGGLGRQRAEAILEGYRSVPAQVLHTARDGCIRIELSAAGLQAQPLRTSPPSHLPLGASANFAQAP